MRSHVTYRSGDGFAPISELTHLTLQAISSGPRWKGVHLELGEADGWDGEDLMVSGHFLSMNRMDVPLHVMIRDEETGDWVPRTLAPDAFWIHPEGSPFSLQLIGRGAWSGAIVDGLALDGMLGGHHELRGGINIVDPLLAALFRALIAALLAPDEEAHVTRSVVSSFMLALGHRHGRKASELTVAPGLDKAAIDALTNWLMARLDTRITVGEMAAHLHLSAAHFSREFKRTTGRAPWENVIELRLQRAAELLVQDAGVASVAVECGFFDQAHLSRAFKRRFGVPPSCYARDARTDAVL